jgi:hypothetical protein
MRRVPTCDWQAIGLSDKIRVPDYHYTVIQQTQRGSERQLTTLTEQA